MAEPLVSIITPCYNCEKWVGRYLERILRQTYDKIELIIINDGSTDGTEEIILSYSDKIAARGYTLVYRRQENKGLGGAINTGLKLISGEYFTWCDSDNFYTDNYVEATVAFFAAHEEYAVVRCDGNVVDESDTETTLSKMSDGNTELFCEKLFYNALLNKNFHFGCAMLRTRDFDAINPEREIYESREGQNWQLMLPMLYAYRAGYMDRAMFYFVQRKNSISHAASADKDKMLAQTRELINILTITVKGMKIPEEEKCLRLIEDKYDKVFLYLASVYKDRALLKKQYKKLKNKKQLDAWCRKTYYFSKYPPIRAASRLLHRLRGAV